MRLMRLVPTVIAVALVWALNHSFSASVPAMGRLIDPVNGAMAAAEPIDADWNRKLSLNGIQAPVEVWLDTSLIPHVRAGNDHDLYFTQGYIHATFRLWQMDLQTRAAWGRVSEVAGPKAIDFDRGMRREGMVWGAQHSLEAMEKDPRTKAMLDAYCDGVNAYIHSLNFRKLPIEYKLMDFAPEEWTNLRTALLMKYMARDLTGKTDDFAFTQLRDQLGQQEFDFLFPEKIKGSKPVIPEGTKWEKPSLVQPKVPVQPFVSFGAAPAISERKEALSSQSGDHNLVVRRKAGHGSDASGLVHQTSFPFGGGWEGAEQEMAIGSNNWAISGQHTASGKAILCNDPHLALNLPSLWFEMQLTAPGINCYGASLPGAPGIVIGFNENISWGFTNNYRDVKDFYEVAPSQPPPKGEEQASEHWLRPLYYRFSGKDIPFEKHTELIKVKGQSDVIDTVLYTIHGPVTYDPSFPPPELKAQIASAGRGATPPPPLGEAGRAASPPLGGQGSAGTPFRGPGGGGRGVNGLYACTWMAHRGSNELLATYLLNRAGNYTAFTDAISHFECPAQNIAYADVRNNIAMWGQGRFINKWKGQGKYVMRGDDSSTLWGESIPMSENPHVLNPPQGFVVSANQAVTDSTYPYWYNGSFTEWRSWEINDILSQMNGYKAAPYVDNGRRGLQTGLLSVELYGDSTFGMQEMQNVSYSPLTNIAELGYFMTSDSASEERFVEKYADANGSFFDKSLAPTSLSGTLLNVSWYFFNKDVWEDEFPKGAKYPASEFTMHLLQNDSASRYYDDKRTQQVETLRDIVQRAYRETMDSLNTLRHAQGDKQASTTQRFNDSTALQWYNVKNTTLTHLAKIPAFSYDHLKIGGWSNTINACTGNHGPSWRMIVEMDNLPQAWAIYPGGQSGNPGSRHYGDFIQQWVEGKYHAIQFLAGTVTKNPLTYTWAITP